MANLNLSQFTEKTFVADADWTFVWDTAGAISKKVSRNNWLNSGELTTSAPVTISQTWNAGAVAFTAFKVNAVSTASAAGSLLLDLQVGGVSQLNVNKSGNLFVNKDIVFGGSAGPTLFWNGSQAIINKQLMSFVGLTSEGYISVGPFPNYSFLVGDGAANTLALRNGTNAQTFNVYGTYSSGSVYERMFARYDGTALAFQVGTQHVGASARPLQLLTDNTARWTISTAGHFIASTDNTYDIGLESTFRPRTGFFSSSFRAPQAYIQYGGSGGLYWMANNTSTGWIGMTARAAGVITIDNFAGTDFGRLQFGGTTASFPALKRSTTSLQAVLANDSGFTNIQGKLTTDTAYTGTTVVPTGFITLYDSTGTAYKVPCVAA